MIRDVTQSGQGRDTIGKGTWDSNAVETAGQLPRNLDGTQNGLRDVSKIIPGFYKYDLPLSANQELSNARKKLLIR